MKTEIWRDCIVTYIDLAATKKIINGRDSRASDLMRKLHSLIKNYQMLHHDHSYCWNDSVLLLAFWDKEIASGKNILKEISNLKCKIDSEIGKSYAISVKGQAFPNADCDRNAHQHCVVLKTSSYAMANCFAIESEAKKQKLQASWYIDSWLKKALSSPFPKPFRVEMLPTRKERDIFPFNKVANPINT